MGVVFSSSTGAHHKVESKAVPEFESASEPEALDVPEAVASADELVTKKAWTTEPTPFPTADQPPGTEQVEAASEATTVAPEVVGEDIWVSVLHLSGELCLRLQVPPSITAVDLRRRVAATLRLAPLSVRLLRGCELLEGSAPLLCPDRPPSENDACHSGGDVVVNLVVSRRAEWCMRTGKFVCVLQHRATGFLIELKPGSNGWSRITSPGTNVVTIWSCGSSGDAELHEETAKLCEEMEAWSSEDLPSEGSVEVGRWTLEFASAEALIKVSNRDHGLVWRLLPEAIEHVPRDLNEGKAPEGEAERRFLECIAKL